MKHWVRVKRHRPKLYQKVEVTKLPEFWKNLIVGVIAFPIAVATVFAFLIWLAS